MTNASPKEMHMLHNKKILVLRFSSIGDIVLTTPVIRAIKQQLPQVTLHFVTKAQFADTLRFNPYLDKLICFKKDIDEVLPELKKEKYDFIIDLHNNLRSLRLKQKLGVKSYTFPKINWQKFIAVNFKKLNVLPPVHIVERYFKAVEKLGVKPDAKGLDYFIAENDQVDISQFLNPQARHQFIALVLGGSYYTKQIPVPKLLEVCEGTDLPIVLLGGKTDMATAEKLHALMPKTINCCGKFNLNQSASVLQQASWVITGDTGLMHIASAYNKRIISLWGNTIPAFGMSPYKPHHENQIIEVNGLKCRPCSKLGYHNCPLKHFHCMMQQDIGFVKHLK